MFTCSYEIKPKYRERVEKLALMCSTDIEDNINELLKDKGWCERQYKDFTKHIFNIICKYIHTVDDATACDKELNHMLIQKEHNEQVFLKTITAHKFNFFDIVLKDKKLKFFKNIELLKDIYRIRGDGVGLGEVFLTFFSECISPQHGDISVGGLIIELKGEQGYIGTEGYWNTTIQQYKDKINHNSTSKALSTIFTELPTLSISKQVKLMLSLRTEQCDYSDIKCIIPQLKTILKTCNHHYKKVILALQIWSYYMKNKFDKIVFIKGDTALCIESGDLETIYNQLLPHEFTLSVSNNLVRNNGYSVTLKTK